MLDVKLEMLVCCPRDKSTKHWWKFLGQKLTIALNNDGETSRERGTKALKRIASFMTVNLHNHVPPQNALLRRSLDVSPSFFSNYQLLTKELLPMFCAFISGATH